MKKVLLILFVVLVLTITLTLVSCVGGTQKNTTTTTTSTTTNQNPNVDPPIHEHSYNAVITAPTCTEQGYTTYTCECGDGYVDEYVDAKGHDYEAVVTEPTTTSQGYTTHTCAHCGDSYVDSFTELLPAYSQGLEFTLNDDGESYSVTGIGTCTDTEIVIPSKHNGLPVKCIGDMAFAAIDMETQEILPSYITNIVIPNTVSSIGMGAFGYCTSLTSIEIPNSVTSIGRSAFQGCSSLTSIEVDENNAYYKSIDGNLYDKDTKTLIQYAIGKEDTTFAIPDSITSIGEAAFGYCTSLTSIVIPNSVTSIGGSAFFYCTSLKNIVIPDSVTSIGGGAFGGCSSLTSIEIPNSVTIIGNNAFVYCSSLTSVVLPDSITSIGIGTFGYCVSLTNITIPAFIKSVGEYAFYACLSINNVYYSGDIEDWCKIDFDSVNWGNPMMRNSNLYFKGELVTNIVIPDSVTSISGSAFEGCSSLTSIEIPDSVTSIGERSFYNCTSLTSITFEGTVEQWNAIEFGERWNYMILVTEVVCSDGTVKLK